MFCGNRFKSETFWKNDFTYDKKSKCCFIYQIQDLRVQTICEIIS